MNFSEKLKLLRKNKGFTQEELAEQLNVSRIAVAKWEAGQTYPDRMNWFQGYEEIYWLETKVYECYFHGGLLR